MARYFLTRRYVGFVVYLETPGYQENPSLINVVVGVFTTWEVAHAALLLLVRQERQKASCKCEHSGCCGKGTV